MLASWKSDALIAPRVHDDPQPRQGVVGARFEQAGNSAPLPERLRNSRNMVLIVGETTRFDTDWVPFEIDNLPPNLD